MIDFTDMFKLFDAYCDAAGVTQVTLSMRLYNEGKKIASLRERRERGLTVERYNHTFRWLSKNWPLGAEWPAGIPRPEHTATDFGARLTALRTNAGMTRPKLAFAVGISTSKLTKLERNERRITLTEAEELARAMDVAPASFFEAGQ